MSVDDDEMGFGARCVIVLPLALVSMVIFVYIDTKITYDTRFMFWTYVVLLWPGLWWMWHPRLPDNPFRYVLNVGGLLGMAFAGSALPYLVLYILLGHPLR
jgi:hypothetical protein